MARRHNAALFHRIVEQRQRRGSAVGAADLKPHLLEYAGNAVAYRGGRRKRKVNYAERGVEPFRRLRRDLDHFLRLAHAVERARHEWVILHRVAENDQLCAAQAVGIAR